MKPSRETIRRGLILVTLLFLAYLLLWRQHPRLPEFSPPPNPGTGEDGSPRSERGAQ
jgi:hypothetical protein